ncbi:ribonuclease HIII [Thermovibrio ammonificans]|uniref:Ribonuclease n=1 Tax=Thermovibrio ammonificans (strain DSM 15698 / JCM 12110 / HB-1) TaxID=648996 RepID=E8T217_THEA1|nr:ribonuclease HIII [Thermovibrio ammonificans]ADU96912.1 ribonuclease HIII [Thermovibrio ammonificans HB-1]
MKLSSSEKEKLLKKLKALGAKEEKPPEHAQYRLRLNDAILTVYKSGSVVYGGKGREKLKELVAETVLSDTELPRIGCDEAGKGEFVGPLVVACIVADEKCLKRLIELGVKDSKKLSNEKVEELASEITETCHGKVKLLIPEKYNRAYSKFKNINRLLEAVYREIVSDLCEKFSPKVVVVDKFSNRAEEVLKDVVKGARLEVRPKAEDDLAVAAASIVAKAVRLKTMKELEKRFKVKLPEGNTGLAELLKKTPKELHEKLFKLHFSVGGKK